MSVGGLSTPVLVGLIALGTAQLTLQVIALVDLARRTVVPGGRKWRWALLIILGALVGALLYLALGRSATPSAGAEELRGGSDAARRRAIDTLYGPDRRP
jgi:hypothetical protein